LDDSRGLIIHLCFAFFIYFFLCRLRAFLACFRFFFSFFFCSR
jgi:hypothetical protein